MELREHVDERGRRPFRPWFDRLDSAAARRVTDALERLALGNTSNVRSVGAGVYEYRIALGPGYGVYFGCTGVEIVRLLCGGTKRSQAADIEAAKDRRSDFKHRKGYLSWH
jgi:putative addiction module killer protein